MLVDTPPPDQLLDGLLHRLEDESAGRSRCPALAVLDPTWPLGLQAHARAALAAAVAQGRLTAADLVLFTSGSSGRPRAVVRTLASWAASLAPLTSLLGLGEDDVVWLPGPLSSGLYLYGGLHARTVGAEVLQTGSGAAIPARATVAHLVPAVLERITGQARRLPGSAQLRTVVVAGSHLNAGLRTQAEQLGLRVLEYYGAAELSFVGWRAASGPLLEFPGARVRVLDGVIWVRSPYLARGYLQDDGAGALRWDGRWASVGDLAHAVPGGFEVCGRGEAAVTTGGHTVLAEEVEQAVRQLPGVRDVAVVGLAHPVLGQRLVAVVVVRDGVRRAHLDLAVRALAPPARPRAWLQASALPHTATGKLARAAVAEQARSLPPLP